MSDLAVSLERMLGEISQLTLETPEGMSYSPSVFVERNPDGTLSRLEVGIDVTGPTGEKHTVRLVPSTQTDEGPGTGNVFLYEDEEPVSHLAWGGE